MVISLDLEYVSQHSNTYTRPLTSVLKVVIAFGLAALFPFIPAIVGLVCEFFEYRKDSQ
jgi:hypothetical protein